jgi:class I lanthipeptide synthase
MTESGGPDDRWRPAIQGEGAGLATDVARDVAIRLADRERVQLAMAEAARQTAFPRSVYWQPSAVAQGDAGLAILFSYLDGCYGDEGWDEMAHEALARAVAPVQDGSDVGPGLFTGLSGIGIAGWLAARQGTRYQQLLRSLDIAVADEAAGLTERVAGARDGLAVSTFDVISGLSGIGAYLLCRRDSDVARRALERVLAALIGLAREPEVGELPAWFTPPEWLADNELARLYPHGNMNCGLAHGIPGPVALMALASRDAVAVDGLDDGLGTLATWLVEHRVQDDWGVNWPTVVPVGLDGRPAPRCSDPSRAAWCYGSPGVARALWLAGAATARADLCALAVEAMEAVYRRPLGERRIDSPTFCHGVAGLLQITLRFLHDTGRPRFRDEAETLVDQIVGSYEPDSILGFRSFEPGGGRVDQPGLLDGAPGVVMVLLAAATDTEPTWDRLFVLS